MRKKIGLIGKHNCLELGYVEDGTYYETGLLADRDHSWKILAWIDQNVNDGFVVRVVRETEGLMEQSQRKNKEALDGIVKGAFKNQVS